MPLPSVCFSSNPLLSSKRQLRSHVNSRCCYSRFHRPRRCGCFQSRQGHSVTCGWIWTEHSCRLDTCPHDFTVQITWKTSFRLILFLSVHFVYRGSRVNRCHALQSAAARLTDEPLQGSVGAGGAGVGANGPGGVGVAWRVW